MGRTQALQAADPGFSPQPYLWSHEHHQLVTPEQLWVGDFPTSTHTKYESFRKEKVVNRRQEGKEAGEIRAEVRAFASHLQTQL